MAVSDMNQAQVNARLAEIYKTLVKMQDLADAVMYNSQLDNVIKGFFVKWYESNYNALKDEIFQYTDQILNNE